MLLTLLSLGSSLAAGLGSLDAAWIALIGTLVGGIGLKMLEHHFGKASRKNQERKDIWQEVKDLQTRIDTLESEVTDWRDRYYKEQEKVAILRLQVIHLGQVPADNVNINLTIEPPNVT